MMRLLLFLEINSVSAFLNKIIQIFIIVTATFTVSQQIFAEEIGSVNTEWKLLGSHKLVVEAYDDPKVEGITCYVSKPERGGVVGAIGIAEEVSDVSIACRQIGFIRFKESIPQKEDALTERRSIIFKTLHVVRMIDVQRNALVYLTYTDKILNGSAKNSVSVVPIDKNISIPLKK